MIGVVAESNLSTAYKCSFDEAIGTQNVRSPHAQQYSSRVPLVQVALSLRAPLRKEVRGDDANEFARRNDLGILPEPWEMPWVAGNKVVSTRCIGALDELVVVRVLRNLQHTRRRHQMRAVL